MAVGIGPGTLTSSMLPHASLGASQLLKPAPTTPRSYGRRHRSWHCEPQAQANCLKLCRQHREATAAGIGFDTTSRRRKPAVETCVNNTARLRSQALALAPRPCTCNVQRAALRATACTPRLSTCAAPQASAWAPRSSTCDVKRAASRSKAWAPSTLPTPAYCAAGASQLLKPASTRPRSYGRRHRSWHYEPQAQTNC